MSAADDVVACPSVERVLLKYHTSLGHLSQPLALRWRTVLDPKPSLAWAGVVRTNFLHAASNQIFFEAAPRRLSKPGSTQYARYILLLHIGARLA